MNSAQLYANCPKSFHYQNHNDDDSLICANINVITSITTITTSTTTTHASLKKYLLCTCCVQGFVLSAFFMYIIMQCFLINQKYCYYHFIGKDIKTESLINSSEYTDIKGNPKIRSQFKASTNSMLSGTYICYLFVTSHLKLDFYIQFYIYFMYSYFEFILYNQTMKLASQMIILCYFVFKDKEAKISFFNAGNTVRDMPNHSLTKVESGLKLQKVFLDHWKCLAFAIPFLCVLNSIVYIIQMSTRLSFIFALSSLVLSGSFLPCLVQFIPALSCFILSFFHNFQQYFMLLSKSIHISNSD